MTLDDAKKLCPIIATVDGGCSVCVGSLVEDLNEQFPDYIWEMKDWYSQDERVEVRRAKTS